MPPLPLLGALLDTAGTALKAVRDAGSSAAAGNDAAASPAAVPFAQTLKQSVDTRHDATNAGMPDAATKQVSATPAAGTKPYGTGDDKPIDDANATPNPDAAALAAAAAVQAQLLARTNDAAPADADSTAAAAQTTAVSGQPDATAALPNHAGKDAAAEPAAPASGRDALQAALAKLTGGAGAIAMPATGAAATAAPAPAATTSASAAAPLTPKVPTFDRALADAKGAPATQQPATQAAAPLQAGATAQPAAQHAFAAAEETASPAADATVAAAATAAAAAQANLQASPAASTIAAANPHVLAPHVGTADWTDALSQKVVFLSNAHQQSAELTLNPPDLGPLQVVLRVADNHAHALFVSQHAQVRDAVEAALPKLREAMEAGGLGLGSATVSDGGFASQQQNPQQSFAGGRSSPRARAGSSAVDAPVDAAQSASAAATVSRAGLVDTFA
ncbi:MULTISPECIES: flagellar hook-length control protein FliK [unclassified Burkholderia]|uniref:flagellar hook-length control protein FliK n=1 Tax=unclassified Burkholderia TaxID=2613784 RepID=UPI000F578E3C|nr:MULTISPECIES: flagellar hook-length control protein FliK [unclassified Burkholderia]RQR43130.1 flagellar hook-length control protein FliK [Burkholderia sp. Bp9131]RQR72976.1 flagellar hook-length control protein FliK [Burkholderia sp. Bp9015]RQR96652.1 flagellar hook-length control protein FliK [Burkholderia sp. Bp8994]RQS31902.1 flagellar hook-length control protein FliK [Burkholderia sp. Bp8995]RQS42019.1 flagellar hook-length control protein FliK [Burkholderia sp. Bp8990]